MIGKPVNELTSDPAESSTDRGVADAPSTGLAEVLAATLAEVMGAGQVSADRHFFDDLGADSLVMAHFCARVRKRADLPSVSMKDVYRNPTINALAAAVAAPAPSPRSRHRPLPRVRLPPRLRLRRLPARPSTSCAERSSS